MSSTTEAGSVPQPVVLNLPRKGWGEIYFPSTRKTSKYIRVPSTVDIEDLYQLLRKEWKLNSPPIIISVTGGEEYFTLQSRTTKQFQRSLIKAAESTEGWLITDGLQDGVTRHVGEAARRYHTTIPPTKVIYNEKNSSRCLDPYHTHYILVDDKSKDPFLPVIELKSKLELYLADDPTTKTKVVSVLIGGDVTDFKTIEKNLFYNMPVVVVEGTGKSADILANVYRSKKKRVSKSMMENLCADYLCGDDDACIRLNLEVMLDLANRSIQKRKLITVFSLGHPDEIRELDRYILQSLLKTYSTSEDQAENQLRLALAWNEPSIADTQILTDSNKISSNELVNIFLDAIQQDKSKFVQLLLDYGLSAIHKGFTYEKLLQLYQTTATKQKSKVVRNEKDLLNLKRNLLGFRYEPYFQNLKRSSRSSNQEDFQNGPIQSIFRELFFYCIVYTKNDCAKVLWNAMNKESFSSAIVASRLLKKLSESEESLHEKQELLENYTMYQTLAYGILTECFRDDEQKTTALLTRRLTSWGQLTALEIAIDTEDINIVAHPAIQVFFDQVWFGALKIKNPFQTNTRVLIRVLSIYLAAFTVFLIPFLFDFRPLPTIGINKDILDVEIGSPESMTSSDKKEPQKNLFWRKIFFFYDTPVVKFYLTIVFYLLFLALYAYILLFNFFKTITGFEITLLVWVCSLVLEEIEILINAPAKGCWNSVIYWWERDWKRLETKNNLVSFCLYFIGFGLRFTIYLTAAQCILCLAFTSFALRLLHLLTINRNLGPQLLMVKKMIQNLYFFLFILFVFLLSYGVTSQSLLYPNEKIPGNVFDGVVSKPYWDIFKGLTLAEVNYNPTTKEFSCTNDQKLLNLGYRRCPQQNRIVPIISALYLLLTNILLLSLLIAMFSYTFSKLVGDSDKIWKRQRYFLILEYYRSTLVVVPFNMATFFVNIFYNDYSGTDNNFVKTLSEDETMILDIWENNNKEKYLERMRLKTKENLLLEIDKRSPS